MLQQKNRLAALGLAVSKINHDLRNLLASAQLFSDRLASVPDPNVQRFAPKLMRSLERAIAFCQSTLSYGQREGAAARPPAGAARRPGGRGARDARPCAGRAGSLGRGGRARRAWSMPIRDQLFRVLLNLVAQCLAGAGRTRRRTSPAATRLRITGQREGAVAVIEVSDTGPGVSEQARAHLFEAFQGSTRRGGIGPRPCHRGRAGARPWRRDPRWWTARSGRPSGSSSPTARSSIGARRGERQRA